MKKMIQGSDKLPVGAVATTVGLCTLANAFNAIGFSGIRHLVMWFALIVWVLTISKIVLHFDTFKKEYTQVVPGSLYAAVMMLTAILSSYIYPYLPILGIGMWYVAVVVHAAHILFFTWRNVIREFNLNTFLPSWFVTYVGILVPVVVGTAYGNPIILKALLGYGFVISAILVPAMFIRILKLGMASQTELMKTIFLAPPSLCLVSYFNLTAQPNMMLVTFLYALICLIFLYILKSLPNFVNRPFDGTFAALTFPMAISLIATLNTARFLINVGHTAPGNFFNQVFGAKLFLITLVIGYVVYHFTHNFVLATVKKPVTKASIEEVEVVE